MSDAKRRVWIAAAAAIALAGAGAMAAAPAGVRAAAEAAQGAQKAKNKKPADTGVLVEDHGTLQIQLGGQPAGSEEFEIHESGGEWTARGTSEVAGENAASTKVTGKLTLTPDGAPLHYEWSANAPRKAGAVIDFEGTVAKMELKMEGAQPYTQEFRFDAPPVVILDNNMYHQYSILARLYDWEHKEPKTYAVLIPQDLTPGSVTVEFGGQQVVDGQKLDELRVRSPDLEIDLYCDPAQQERLVRLEVPAAKAVIVRQGPKK
jgi:hypothetical protein